MAAKDTPHLSVCGLALCPSALHLLASHCRLRLLCSIAGFTGRTLEGQSALYVADCTQTLTDSAACKPHPHTIRADITKPKERVRKSKMPMKGHHQQTNVMHLLTRQYTQNTAMLHLCGLQTVGLPLLPAQKSISLCPISAPKSPALSYAPFHSCACSPAPCHPRCACVALALLLLRVPVEPWSWSW